MSLKDFRTSLQSISLQLTRPSAIPLRTEELRALEFFQTQTLPVVLSIFSSELWERSVLAVAYSVPAIMHLVIAISSYHQRLMSLGVSAWQRLRHIDCPEPILLYAQKNHAEAARLVQKLISSKTPPMALIKLACVIFTMLEFLRGSRITTISHLLNGMNLLNDRYMIQQSEPFEMEVDAIMSRLSLMQSLYGRPRSTLFPVLKTVPNAQHVSHTVAISTIQEARMSMVHLSSSVFLFVRKVEQSQTSPQTTEILTEQDDLNGQLQHWLFQLEKLSGSTSSPVDVTATELLRVYHSICFLFLQTVTTQYQTSFDQHIPVFQSAVEALEKIIGWLSTSSEVPILFSLDLALIPCLFYIAIKCRDPTIRRRAVAILNKAPRREGLWDAREAVIVAEHVIEFEERNIYYNNIGECRVIPEESRVQDVDIKDAILDEKATLCLVLRSRPYATCKELVEQYVYIDMA